MAEFINSKLDGKCLGKIFYYIDLEKKAGRTIYGPQHLTDKFYEWLETRKMPDNQIDWYDNNKELVLAWATSYQIKKPQVFGTKSPLEKRVFFGDNFNRYDVGYGIQRNPDYSLKGFVSDVGFYNLLKKYVPWTRKHVDKALDHYYKKDLEELLVVMTKDSPIARKVALHWLANYDKLENAALIPELCGTSHLFKAEKDGYGCYKIGESTSSDAAVVRFDFAVLNYERQTKTIIELDGHAYHKSKTDRGKDAVKRLLGTEHDFKVINFTGTQIHNEWVTVKSKLDKIFR